MSQDKQGNPKPDTKLRDSERVPLTEDIDDYYEREVKPHVPDSWIDRKKNKVGYEINFNRYFYQYTPLRSLKEITDELLALERKSEDLFLLAGLLIGAVKSGIFKSFAMRCWDCEGRLIR